MKALFLASATLLAAAAQAATPAGCVNVEVQNVRPQQGQLMVAAYADADSFGKKPLVQVRVPAGEATTRFELCGLSGDVVALTLFQDLDSDGKMAKNLLGMPTEPWGASGKPGTFGPSWDSGRVPLDGTTIVVKLTA
ncbi:MAG: hypothetical protein RJA10_2881 [Pseudomonadota bacterium]